MIYHLVYSSVAVNPFIGTELLALLQKARVKNTSLGITGILLYRRNTFMQLLEGEQKAVLTLYRIIGEDPRHHQVVTLLSAPAGESLFPDWSMGYQSLDDGNLAAVEGYNPEPNLPFSDEALPWKTSMAMRLLAGFAQRN